MYKPETITSKNFTTELCLENIYYELNRLNWSEDKLFLLITGEAKLPKITIPDLVKCLPQTFAMGLVITLGTIRTPKVTTAEINRAMEKEATKGVRKLFSTVGRNTKYWGEVLLEVYEQLGIEIDLTPEIILRLGVTYKFSSSNLKQITIKVDQHQLEWLDNICDHYGCGYSDVLKAFINKAILDTKLVSELPTI